MLFVGMTAVLATLPRISNAQFHQQRLIRTNANTVEAAVGLEILPFRDYDAGRSVAALVALRHQFDPSGVAIRASAWWLHRSAATPLFINPDEFTTVTALTGAMDVAIQLSEQASVEPYFGGGVVTDGGGIATFGVTVRRKRLLLGQHVVTLSGRKAQFFPLTLGWRF